MNDIPLLLPKLKINNYEIKWVESIKFFRVLLDENLIAYQFLSNIKTWSHIK